MIISDRVVIAGHKETSRTSEQENYEGCVRKILLVDDSLGMLLLGRIIGKLTDINLVTANTAEQALDLAKSEKPDLILIAKILPDMNGIESMRGLQDLEETKEIPVIVFSGSVIMSEEVERQMAEYEIQHDWRLLFSGAL